MPAGKIKRRKKNGKKKEKKKGKWKEKKKEKKKGKEKEKKSTGSLSPTVNLELGPDNPSPQKSYTVICSDVSCGQHYAESCAECPGKDGENFCNGQCEWINNTCVQSTRTPEDLYKSALEKIKGKKKGKKSTGSLSSTANLEFGPDNPSPQKSYIYCHLFRRKLRATLRRELRRVSRKRWMGELLQ